MREERGNGGGCGFYNRHANCFHEYLEECKLKTEFHMQYNVKHSSIIDLGLIDESSVERERTLRFT